MTTVSRTFPVTPSPESVFAYLADLSHAEQWDPGTETCRRSDNGPLAVGATWHNVPKFAGVRNTLTELTDSKIVVVGNGTATSTDTITVEPDGPGSVITYRADLEMPGAAKLAVPAMKLIFEKLVNDTEKRTTEVLNRREAGQ